MATARFTSNAWSMTAERDVIDVTLAYAYSSSESWHHTDQQGHEHYYDRGYPTLEFVVDEQHWCDGSEGWAHHDPHWAIDESHYECLLCREVIEPALDPPGTPKSIPGAITATLEGPLPDGRRVAVLLRESEFGALVDAGDEFDVVAERIASTAAPERIVETSFSS